MASKPKNVAMRAKRKKLDSSSDDEKNQSGIANDDDDDDKPILAVGPRPKEAQVAEMDSSQVRETIIGGWRLVRLDGQYVRVKMTREEKLLIRGESVSQDEDSEEDDEPEPDYQLSDEERPYIDSMQPDFMDNVPILVLKSAIQAAQSARRAVGALGALKIKFTSFSARE